MARAKIIYPSGDPAPNTYVFPRNFTGPQIGYLETDDNQRMLDGTLRSYNWKLKRTFTLPFVRAPLAQLQYLAALWVANYDLDLYLDGTNYDATVQIMEPPERESTRYRVQGLPLCSFSLVMQEL